MQTRSETPGADALEEPELRVIQHSFPERWSAEKASNLLVGSGFMTDSQTVRDERVDAVVGTCCGHQEILSNQTEHEYAKVPKEQGQAVESTPRVHIRGLQTGGCGGSFESANAMHLHLPKRSLVGWVPADVSLEHGSSEQERAVAKDDTSRKGPLPVSQETGEQHSRDQEYLYGITQDVLHFPDDDVGQSRNGHAQVSLKSTNSEEKEQDCDHLLERFRATELGDNAQELRGRKVVRHTERQRQCTEEASIAQTSRTAERNGENPVELLLDASACDVAPCQSVWKTVPSFSTSNARHQGCGSISTRQSPVATSTCLNETSTTLLSGFAPELCHMEDSTAPGDEAVAADLLPPGDVRGLPGPGDADLHGHNQTVERKLLHETTETQQTESVDKGVLWRFSSAAETGKTPSKNALEAVTTDLHRDRFPQGGETATNVNAAMDGNIQARYAHGLAEGNTGKQTVNQSRTLDVLGIPEEQVFKAEASEPLTRPHTAESEQNKGCLFATQEPQCRRPSSQDNSFPEQTLLPTVQEENSVGWLNLLTNVLPGDGGGKPGGIGQEAMSESDHAVPEKKLRMTRSSILPTGLSDEAQSSCDGPGEQKTGRNDGDNANVSDRLPERVWRKKSWEEDTDHPATEPDQKKPKLTAVASDIFSDPRNSPSVIASLYSAAVPASPLSSPPSESRTPGPLKGMIMASTQALARRASREENARGNERGSSHSLATKNSFDSNSTCQVRQRCFQDAIEEGDSLTKSLSSDRLDCSWTINKKDDESMTSGRERIMDDPPSGEGTRQKRRQRQMKLIRVLDEDTKESEEHVAAKVCPPCAAELHIHGQERLIRLVAGAGRGTRGRGRIRWNAKSKCSLISAPQQSRGRGRSIRKRFFLSRKDSEGDALTKAEVCVDQQIKSQDASTPQKDTQKEEGTGTERCDSREEEENVDDHQMGKEDDGQENKESERQPGGTSLWINRLRSLASRESESHQQPSRH
ncbi:conserved hypothetical protein [Neospora caninum Liverpool]|uniref:Uncharacterized protein n=1 Tax=Neospora caninum (strain Liverpool) TaxID=572307 RepID=F0VBF9_NEOCL|nr:conserved hypothetical protein [Neospora caninum Liverpool]CBZ50943.1 conserved hypothetical protein [Neospora caninum Liverpool]CEL68244.1 TPA: hypothetical protein BN1204_040180 [Neospora caninum Liverpool]|eukprot:XP_003880976.1 conserved hypothetical protein [Neospora caninum Liverpool]